MTQASDRHWLQVGEFVANFGGNELAHTTILSGCRFQLNFEDDSSAEYRFVSGNHLEVGHEAADPHCIEVPYHATQLRAGVLLVDYIDPQHATRSVSIVLDLERKVCIRVAGELPTREQTLVPLFTRVQSKQSLSAVSVNFQRGTIDAAFSAAAELPAPTDELVGRRIHHEYGKHDAYEHIYLETDLYSWHCTKGPEVGLADTDRCFMYRLREELFLFVWIEKIIPTLGVLMMDTSLMRTTGKLFGYRGDDFGATINSAVGATSRLANVTRHER